MRQSGPIESELKIPVSGLEPVRERLRACGAHCLESLQRERNQLYDTVDGRLQRAGRALRLRRVDRRAVITLKGPATWDGGIKHREELETTVGDGDVVDGLLTRLGYVPGVRYEKDRETWNVDGVVVTLDRTPMGDFVEIEGPPDRLHTTARDLELDPGDAVTGSYLSLWAEHRKRHPENNLPPDMLFADP